MSGKSRRLFSQEDQDELEYNITFPTSTGLNYAEEPVIYLLGWASSIDDDIAQYSSIYEKERCITIRYIHPAEKIFFLTPDNIDDFKHTATKLMQLLEDYDLAENPVMVHSFSNSGALLYRYMADMCHVNKVGMIGAVFDSAPSKRELKFGLRAFYFCFKSRGIFPFLNYLSQFVFHAIYTSISSFLSNRKVNYFSELELSKNHLWPHLYLYSSQDTIIPSHHVLEMVQGRKLAGVSLVKTYDFRTTDHVGHLNDYKEEYRKQCVTFLDESLNIYDSDDPLIVEDDERTRESSVDPENIQFNVDDMPTTSCSKI